jgi:hypothetical protein
VVIKGKFPASSDILEGIKLVERIIDRPKMFKEQKLPFKHVRKSVYKTNHFSGEVLSADGGDFHFANNIKKYDWKTDDIELDPQIDYAKLEIPKLNLRIASMAQLKEIGKFIKKFGFNPVNSIEYGEVASTVDLSSKSFDDLVVTVKKFCKKHNIALNLSTPRVLIERDFERVYELIKTLALENPRPKTVVINNIGFLWNFINDAELSDVPVEIGGGINLLNSYSIKCLSNLNPINALDFTFLGDYENIEKCVKAVGADIITKKMFIAGCFRIESLGLCPLNCDSAIISRLSCSAPCHKGHWCLKDPSLNKTFPFVVDGFCKMHMFEDGVIENFEKIPHWLNVGINEFVLDFSAIHAPLLPKVLKKYLRAVEDI